MPSVQKVRGRLSQDSVYGHTSSVTFEGVKGRDSLKVARFFQEHPNEHFTPKQIAIYCRIGHSSAKMICQRFFKKGWLDHTLTNHYEYTQKITAEELKRIEKFLDHKYHNFILTVGHTHGHTSGVTPSKVTNQNSNVSKFHTGEEQFMVKSVSVKIFHYPQKSVFYLACSENPLDYGELMRVIGTIEGKGHNLEGSHIERIEPNIDIPDLQIDGAQRIELRTFQNCWQRYYNKKSNLLRKEYIIRGAHLPLEEVFAVMRGEQTLGTNVLTAEIEELRKEQKQMNEAVRKMSDTYRELIVAIDRMKAAEKNSKITDYTVKQKKFADLLKKAEEREKPRKTTV